MHIASFAGFAPVNNPVIAVAVVIDSPKGAYYGADVSAPVFAEVAQQVLEYLGVPHDIDLRPVAASKPPRPSPKTTPLESDDDIKALYDAANDLPSDDPLQRHASPRPLHRNASHPSRQPAASRTTRAAARARRNQQAAPDRSHAAQVTLQRRARLRVPSLVGLPVRKVIEQAAAAGLEVQIVGNGTAREQAPPPAPWFPPAPRSSSAAESKPTPQSPLPGSPIHTPVADPTSLPANLQSTSDMNWNELIAEITAVGSTGSSDAPITGIEYDSRRVRPGAVFVAMKGGSTDGNRYVDKAIAAGALGIITDSAPTFDHLARLSGRPARARSRARPPRAGAGLRRLLRPSRAQARRHRHHRHQRQNHHRLSHRSAAQRRRPQNRPHRHHRISRRRRSAPLHPHHARVARPLRADGRRRSPRRHRTGH